MKTQIPVRPGFMPQGMARPLVGRPVPAVVQPQDVEPYIDKEEVAKRFGRSVRCVDNWMKRKLIPFFKVGRTVTFKWSEVEAHLSQHCRAGRAVSTPATGSPKGAR